MNKAILMGRLTKDPELRTTQNNVSVCSFTLAVDRRFKNQFGEREADFIPVVTWRQNAEFVARYFSKGSKMLAVGSIQPRSWDDQEGKRHYITEVIADEIYFADSKRNENGNTMNDYNNAERSNLDDNFIADTDRGFSPEDDGTSLPFEL